MPTRVNYDGAVRKMRALGSVLKRPLRDVLDSGARVAAISCAKSTVPFGTGQDAKSAGEAAVRRDISRVYGNAGGAFEAINGKREKGAFWTHYKKGDYDAAEDIANDAGVKVGDFDGGAAHRSARNRRGRVNQTKPSIFIIRPSERRQLDRYIKQEVDHVGTAKGGWVDVVRAIGGQIRGLREEGDITANWITRKGRGYGRATRGGSEENPQIKITSRIPYADQALGSRAKAEAIRIAKHRSLENLRYAVNAEARKLRTAA